MIPSLQFTDFHKFLVSLGGLLIALAVAAQIFLLRPLSSLLVTDSQLKGLTPVAAKAVAKQQGQANIVLDAGPWVSGILFAIGLGVLTWGAIIWRKRQQALNERESAELAKVQAEAEKLYHEKLALIRQRSLSDEEVANDIRAEVEGEKLNEVRVTGNNSGLNDTEETESSDSQVTVPNEGSDQENPTMSIRDTANALKNLADSAPTKYVSGMLRYLETQEFAVAAIEKAYEGKLDVTRNVQLGGRRADMIVTSRAPGLPNLVVEVKTLDFKYPSGLQKKVDGAIDQAAVLANAAEEKFDTLFRPLIIFIARNPKKDYPYDLNRMVRCKLSGFDLEGPQSRFNATGADVTIIMSTEDQIEHLDIAASLLSGGTKVTD